MAATGAGALARKPRAGSRAGGRAGTLSRRTLCSSCLVALVCAPGHRPWALCKARGSVAETSVASIARSLIHVSLGAAPAAQSNQPGATGLPPRSPRTLASASVREVHGRFGRTHHSTQSGLPVKGAFPDEPCWGQCIGSTCGTGQGTLWALQRDPKSL